MKKWLRVLLVMCLCYNMLAGCGSNKEKDEAEKVATEQKEYVILEKKAKTIEGVCSYRIPEKWEETESLAEAFVKL